MSFRNRLGLFFVLIVIVPMVAVAVLLFGLLGKSEQSMGDADIRARQVLAQQLFVEHRRAADKPLAALAGDGVFATALVDGDTDRARRRARQLLATLDVERIVLAEGRTVVLAAGDKTAIAPALRPLESENAGTQFGELGVSVTDARAYASQVKRTTGLNIVVRNGNRVLGTTLPAAAKIKLPTQGEGEVEVGGTRYRVSNFVPVPNGFPGQSIRVYTLGVPQRGDSGGRGTIAVILIGFLLLALASSALVSRSLQQQLQGFLDAAKKLAAGDFSAQVATVGKDEFAGLGEEFNKMARELKRRIEELREAVHESLTDDLTGLPNRRAFDVRVTNRVRDLDRLGGTLGLALIDLDNFKSINDTYGHPQGDAVLREVARVLRESVREIDLPARYGGEEFALLLPGTDVTGAFELAERVRRGIEALHIPMVDGGGTLRVTASAGVGSMPETRGEWGPLVTAVDEALYEAKATGKNKTVRAR